MTAVIVSNTEGWSASATSYDVPLPGTIVSGELLVAIIVTRVGSTQTFDAVTGWTKEFETTASGLTHQHAIYSRVASGSEGSTQTMTVGTSAAWTTHVLRVQDHDGLDTVYSSAGGGFGSTIDAPSITTSADDALLVTLYGVSAAEGERTISAPSGFTGWGERDVSGVAPLSTIAALVQASAGASGAKTWSHTGGDTVIDAAMFAIAPAAGGGVSIPVVMHNRRMMDC